MIDPFHLEAYGETAVNYNRDIEIFPVLNAIFEGIYGSNPYKSPTDMGVNMAGHVYLNIFLFQLRLELVGAVLARVVGNDYTAHIKPLLEIWRKAVRRLSCFPGSSRLFSRLQAADAVAAL